jgi:hypothetical protein
MVHFKSMTNFGKKKGVFPHPTSTKKRLEQIVKIDAPFGVNSLSLPLAKKFHLGRQRYRKGAEEHF